MKPGKIYTENAINAWLIENEWVSQRQNLLENVMIQNVIDDTVALVINVEYMNESDLWFVGYFCEGRYFGYYAEEMWNWRIL